MPLKLDLSDASSVLFDVSGGPDIRVQYRLRLRGAPLLPSSLSMDGSSARADFIGPEGLEASVEDSFLERGGLLTLRRRWTLFKQGPWALNASFSVAIGKAEVFVPAVLYRGNEMGKGAFPKRETSPAWSFLETRSPLPSCVQLYDAASSFICAAESASEIAFLSSAEGSWEEGRAKISIDLPASERPSAYTGKTSLVAASDDGPEGLLFPGRELPVLMERVFYLALADIAGRSSFSAYRDFIAVLPPSATSGGGPGDRSARGGDLASWDEYEARKTAHLLSLVELAPDGKSAYLAMGRRNGALQSVYDYTAGSFLVKSLEGALVLARSSDPGECAAPFLGRLSGLFGVESGPKLFSETAERIGRFFLKGEVRPGVHQDCYDTEREIWGGYLGISEHDAFRHQVNARCNGEVMKAYVQLYEEFRRRGRDLPEFIELPRRVARFYLDRQLGGSLAGSFGRWWSVEGEAVDKLGTNGAYVASFLVALEPHFDDASRLAAAIEGAGAYYARLAAMGDFFGDTLDADSCDKEAGAALLSLFLDLFERDGNRAWLDRARDAAEFVLSWIWQYDCPFPPDSPLGSRRFSTRGMSSVSVAHHHLDFYGMSIAYDFLRYAERSGDGLYRSQADMMLRACRQLVAGPEDYLGRGAEDLGWQPEQINHTAWDYFDRPERQAGHFDIDIAWIAVLGLGGFQRVKARYPDALERSGMGA
jgi:hypothetical protein